MWSIVVTLLFLGTMGAAVAAGVGAFWRSVDPVTAEREGRIARARREEEAWRPFAALANTTITELDLRESGWTEARVRSFLGDHFGSRREIRIEELKPHLDDVLVRDVLVYRQQRVDAAKRYEPIRHTWVSVDQLERDKALPHELRPLVTERERQSGRLIKAGDLIPYVGRPVVRALLEERLEEVGAKPLEH